MCSSRCRRLARKFDKSARCEPLVGCYSRFPEPVKPRQGQSIAEPTLNVFLPVKMERLMNQKSTSISAGIHIGVPFRTGGLNFDRRTAPIAVRLYSGPRLRITCTFGEFGHRRTRLLKIWIAPSSMSDPNHFEWENMVEQVKRAIRTKVLGSYRNGQAGLARENRFSRSGGSTSDELRILA